MKNEEIQKQLYQIEIYKQQINRLQEELGKIELIKLEILKSIESMEGLKQSKEVLIPLGGGVFTKATVHDSEKIIANVGADVFVEKPIDETIKDFKESVEELNTAENKIREQISKTLAAIEKLQKELESKISVMEKGQTPESS
ncbi:prefoldin subunit alpha [Methanofervidicoccus sp. A16]|uniref:prefoldin subunit alpha n=1 Tax=Methanofervidicoccus sp. A16 TaxID=2607662 RepID=UPI00118955FD|nr:prefoldin subunit alpha [Methanofervidicoccus sp. A16]AXI24841.1 prefoldin subunit alpha [Methanofervidicoccus sp. A16]